MSEQSRLERDVKVSYTLIWADPFDRTGVLEMKNQYPIDSPTKRVNLSLSHLLAWRLKKQMLQDFIKKNRRYPTSDGDTDEVLLYDFFSHYDQNDEMRKKLNLRKVEPLVFIGTTFTSTCKSKEYNENPFKLKEFNPIKGSDVPTHYELCIVDEKYVPPVLFKDALGNHLKRYETFVSRTLNPNQYTRYAQFDNTRMLADLSDDVIIVIP